MEQVVGYQGALILPLLGLVAFFDTVIGIGFFVPGEIAFVSAGATLAETGNYLVLAVVWMSGWAGDLTSFFLGRRHGMTLVVRFLRPLKRRCQWRKASRLLQRFGAIFVIAARFLGPVAWITPFLAGAAGMGRGRFALASVPAVVLGSGQFILLGYGGAQVLAHWQALTQFAHQHVGVLAVSTIVVIGVGLTWWMVGGHRALRVLCAALAGVSLFCAANLYYFFGTNAHASTPESTPPFLQDVCSLNGMDLRVYPGSTNLHLPQPINVALLSKQPPEAEMRKLGWVQNMTFSQHEIGLRRYLELLFRKIPPVSEMYFRGAPARSAFQLPGSLAERIHIRWWGVGEHNGLGLYLGAISRDEELAIKYYRDIPALLHDIDPEVDQARGVLEKHVQNSALWKPLGLAQLSLPLNDGFESDYQTDGRVFVVVDADVDLLSMRANCLSFVGQGVG